MRRRAKPAKEAKPPVARKSRKNEGSRVGDLEKRLAEALEQQTATSDVLRVISSSPTDLAPVFRTILVNAARLCDAQLAFLFRYDVGLFELRDHWGDEQSADFAAVAFPRAPFAASPSIGLGRIAAELRPVQIADVTQDPAYAEGEPLRVMTVEIGGCRTWLGVPLLKEGRLVGAFVIWRREVHPFTDRQIALVSTFGDQAVIAIENVRLFTELQEKNRALTQAHAQVTESLEQQTATSEILRVIASSPTDIQPVLDVVAENAARLCEAKDAVIRRIDGDTVRVVATYGPMPTAAIVTPITGRVPVGRAIIDRQTIHVHDVAAEFEEIPEFPHRMTGTRTLLVTPLLREGVPIGVINVRRTEVRPFTEKQIALLKTFADQAVIAIENVRLFNETKDALERQTATAEILRVISSSPTDLQPVLETVTRTAARLCDAVDAMIFRVDGAQLLVAAHHGPIPLEEPVLRDGMPLTLATVSGRTVLEARRIHVDDLPAAKEEFPEGGGYAQRLGYRTTLSVPLLRQGTPLGAITIRRREVRPFTQNQMELLQTFADQAVIAIENVRLFTELQTSNRELTTALDTQTATSDILNVISRSQTDVQPVFDAILTSAVRLLAGYAGTMTRLVGDQVVLVALTSTADAGDATLTATFPRPVDAPGTSPQAIRDRVPVNIADAQTDPRLSETGHAIARARGYQSMVAVPMLRHDEALGAIAVTRREPGGFTEDEIALLRTFADQAVIAIENVRMFSELQERNQEIEQKSRELAAASQHKSEFLANMSHELRTPLNAIIGFSEVLTERMFGELNEKQEEYLKDIYASGQHLLSLINDILDLSKIEAGRMELELTDFDLPTALDNALILVRERAGRRGITLEHSMDERLGEIRGDERKVKQVLLNLLSNALKFTPEGGRVEVRAGMVNGMAKVSVTDTGVGIAPEDQGAIFEEFRQVGTADKKAEGTGLGLTLCRKFVELHGGRIGVTSQVGVGSTFTFTIPVHRNE